jgi:8-oxo-dGTP diphosphatase
MVMKKSEYQNLDSKRGVKFIGVGVVFYCHDGKGNLLFHKRSDKCRDEVGRWDVGGGAIEFGEDPIDAAKREIKEEYCTEVKNIKLVNTSNVLRVNGETKTHWYVLLFVAEVDPKKVKIGEPEKMLDLGWFPINNPPQPLHSMLSLHLDMIKHELPIK